MGRASSILIATLFILYVSNIGGFPLHDHTFIDTDNRKWVLFEPRVRYSEDSFVIEGHLYEKNSKNGQTCMPAAKTNLLFVPDPERCDSYYYLSSDGDKYNHFTCPGGKYLIQLAVNSGVCVRGSYPEDCFKNIIGCKQAIKAGAPDFTIERSFTTHRTDGNLDYIMMNDERTWGNFRRNSLRRTQRESINDIISPVKVGTSFSNPIKGFNYVWYRHEPRARYHGSYANVDGFLYYKCRAPSFARDMKYYPTPDTCTIYTKINSTDLENSQYFWCPEGQYFKASSYKDMKCVPGPLPRDCYRVIKGMKCIASLQDQVYPGNWPINPKKYFRQSTEVDFVKPKLHYNPNRDLLLDPYSMDNDYIPFYHLDIMDRKWRDYEPSFRVSNGKIVIGKHLYENDCSLPPFAHLFSSYPHPEMCDHYYTFEGKEKIPTLQRCATSNSVGSLRRYSASSLTERGCYLLEADPYCYRNIWGCKEALKWGASKSTMPRRPQVSDLKPGIYFEPKSKETITSKSLDIDGERVDVHPLVNQNLGKVSCEDSVIEGITFCKGWTYDD